MIRRVQVLLKRWFKWELDNDMKRSNCEATIEVELDI